MTGVDHAVGVTYTCNVRKPRPPPATPPANVAYGAACTVTCKHRVQMPRANAPLANVTFKRRLQTPPANTAYEHCVQTCHLQLPLYTSLANATCKRSLQTPPAMPPASAAYKRHVQVVLFLARVVCIDMAYAVLAAPRARKHGACGDDQGGVDWAVFDCSDPSRVLSS